MPQRHFDPMFANRVLAVAAPSEIETVLLDPSGYKVARVIVAKIVI